MPGNTTNNSFQTVNGNVSANALWEHPSGKYTVHRKGVGIGFVIKIKKGQLPKRLRGSFVKQEGARQAIDTYEAVLRNQRPSRGMPESE